MIDGPVEETEASESADYVEEVLVDLLTGEERKATDVEHIVQRMIRILAGEYHFPLEAIGRDIPITIETSGRLQRQRTVKADLVVFQPGMTHQLANIERLIVVRKPEPSPAIRRTASSSSRTCSTRSAPASSACGPMVVTSPTCRRSQASCNPVSWSCLTSQALASGSTTYNVQIGALRGSPSQRISAKLSSAAMTTCTATRR
jgi:hypothetical protein